MNSRYFNKSSGIIAATFMALAIMAVPQDSQATTSANTKVDNEVTIGWNSTGGTSYTAKASVSITVNLVKAAPVIAFVSESPDARLAADAVDEITNVVLTYGIYSQANGPSQYTLNTLGVVNTTIGSPTIPAASTSLPADFYLGAASVAYPAASGVGKKSFYVPKDLDLTDGLIGGANGFSAAAGNNQIRVGGNVYEIATITEDTSGDTDLPIDYRGDFSKITLTTDLITALAPGDQIGQYKTFSFTATTGIIADPSITGKHAITVSVQDVAGVSYKSNDVTTDINVARCNLNIMKSVNTGSGFVDSTLGTNSTAGSATTTVDLPALPSGTSGKEIFYKITVSNTTNKQCTNVSVTDVLSPYVAYKVGNPVFAQGGTSSTLDYAAVTTTKKFYNQSNLEMNGTAAPVPVSGGGGAPTDYDAQVSKFTIDFGSATMAGSSSFTLTYSVWLH